MSNQESKPVIWLKEGHVCGFTLPLPQVILERWQAGHLVRVNEDGSTYQGPHFVLPDGTGADEADAGPSGPERPKKSASRLQWAVYAVAIGACTEAEADKKSRDELIELTTVPEEKPGPDGE